MALLNVDVDQAAKDAVDEAAIKLDPMIQAAIVQLLAGLRTLLVGRTITIKID